MIYDHRVKVNGHWINPGVEVNTSTSVKSEPKTENKINDSQFKRSDIQKMKADELRELAISLEIEFDDETSANQLKKDILIKLGI